MIKGPDFVLKADITRLTTWVEYGGFFPYEWQSKSMGLAEVAVKADLASQILMHGKGLELHGIA